MQWTRALASLTIFLAGATAAPAATPAAKLDLSGAFVRFCGDTNGNAERALQQADAAGWALPQRSALAPVPFGSGKWIDLRGRWNRAAGGLMVLEVGTIRDPDGKSALVCTVAETPPAIARLDFNEIERALQGWVGGPPMKASEGFAIFAYQMAGPQRVALTGPQDLLDGDTVRTRPNTALISLVDVFGITPTITYMRWQ